MADTRLAVQQSLKLSQNLQTAIHLLSLDLDGLSDYMQKAVQENPALEYLPPRKSPQEYAMSVRFRYGGSCGVSGGMPETASAPDTALDDLEQQLRLSWLGHDVLRVAIDMLHLLTPRGYFTQDISEFAREAGISPQLAREALRAIQALEPAGVGARTVAECLELQLQMRADADPLCYRLVREYLMEIARGNIRLIARETGAPAAQVTRCVQTIRSLTPAPCCLHDRAPEYIMPEFSVESGEDGRMSIQFHNDYYPSFRQDENFQRLADTLSGDELAYARKMLVSASQLIQAAELRQKTIDKVARVIVREQHAFFKGDYSLLPLRVDEVSSEIGVHETTIYRAIQNKYLYCDRGTFPLGHFFQRELAGGSSAARVKELIRDICRESVKLSDREIAQALETRGIRLSRRTVAKYRANMEINSSFCRAAGDGRGAYENQG